jgi:transposase
MSVAPRTALGATEFSLHNAKTAKAEKFRPEQVYNVQVTSRYTALKKAYCPKRIYRRRHKIENFFCRIKDWRRIATRYDKLARNYLAATTLIGALYWIKL